MKKSKLIEIDGSAGEGGGQILRSALSLSLITGQPFRITRIRAGRKKPGLLRQHLTAVRAAMQIGGGSVDGAEMGSLELVFHPEGLHPGEIDFAIGTAGSTLLVLQTILPALLKASGPSTVVLEGGTHNPLAPTYDFLLHTFLPQLARFGAKVDVTLERPGFYPAGGGRLVVAIQPLEHFAKVELLERGEDIGRRVTGHIAGLDPEIATRAFAKVQKRMGWGNECLQILEHPGKYGPGFALAAEVRSAEITEVFTAIGEKGVAAEKVADEVVDQVRRYLASTAPVGEYLADQLLIPIALAGSGAFRTIGLSRHALTNIEVIQQFLPVRFEVEGAGPEGAVVRLG